MIASGEFISRRREQQVKWMWSMLDERITQRLRSDASIRARVKEAEAAVAEGRVTPSVGADTMAHLLGF
jgi:LAO/AO transport system kinase